MSGQASWQAAQPQASPPRRSVSSSAGVSAPVFWLRADRQLSRSPPGRHPPGQAAAQAVSRILNQEIKCAQAAGLTVLYCFGEKSEEQADWENVLGAQLDIGLDGVDKSRVVIAYEPIWSIGPGKTPADKPYITKIARFVKARTGGLDVVYGGGLKQDNAAMLASIDEIAGGLIALPRFSGEIGFYPDEYLDIIRRYLGK